MIKSCNDDDYNCDQKYISNTMTVLPNSKYNNQLANIDITTKSKYNFNK